MRLPCTHMTNQQRYERLKKSILADKSICTQNRELFRKFFEYEEYKLRRINGLIRLDESCFKTLLDYCSRLRTVNAWFGNKPWMNLTESDIKRVYDALEDGQIKTRTGTPFKNRRTYYNKIFKSKPFDLVGKAEMARRIMNEFTPSKEEREVRFVDFPSFRQLVNVATQPRHKFLMWLAWDIGENVSSLLRLRKSDFHRQTDPETAEAEYRINLPKQILKRARRQRSEITNFTETVEFADLVLRDLDNTQLVFPFGYRQAKKVFDRAVRLTSIRCTPGDHIPTWKDLRSGMACHLLKEGWSREEINSRLGHVPSSAELDKYINFLALDRHKPKQKLRENSLLKTQQELRRSLHQVRHLKSTVDDQQRQIAALTNRTTQLGQANNARQFADHALTQALSDPALLSLVAQAMVKNGLHQQLMELARKEA